MLRFGLFGLFLGALALTSCSRPEPATALALKKRAAFELTCNYVELVRIDDTTAGVWGCGRRAVYLHTCNEFACRWTIEREVQEPRLGYPLPAQPAVVRAHIPSPPDEWRKRVPALAEDEPGF